jgi:DNA-binding winged helix-turn-helix (wHTH) protein/TolB-like protein/Flp pilus assembly protein TadD
MSFEMRRLYKFDIFCVNVAERRFLRDGKVVQLAPKAFDALLVLVESGGRVLDRGELIKRIWPDSDAGEANLAVMISSLRKSLGERPDGGLYIETVPKQGYRFAVSVTELTEESGEPDKQAIGPTDVHEATVNDTGEPVFAGKDRTTASTHDLPGRAPANRKAMILAVAVAVGAIAAAAYFLFFRPASSERKTSQPRYLAILPFRNLKPDKETDFLGSSLAEATTTKLRYVGSLIVRPSAYVEKYRGEDVDPKKAASELNVDTLMTGTYLKEGSSLTVTVQLIDVSKGEVLSSFPFETKFDKLIAVQDKVAQNIIDQLHVKLTDVEAERFGQKGTENPRAYEYFLHGTDMYSRNEFLEAVPMLEKAVELDPNFAIAWAHLGRAYNACASFNLRGRSHHLKAQAAYEQSIALNPSLIEATIFMANLLTDTNRAEQAVPMLRKLLDDNPNIAEARWELGYAYRFAGMLSESIEQCERARAIDPNVKINSSAFNSYLYTGQYEKFINSLPAGEDSAFVVFYRGLGNYYLKNFEQAARDFDRAYEMYPQLYNRVGKALSYSIKNEKPVALDIVRDVEREIEQSGVGDAEGIYKVAQAYAALGDKESALRVLRRSIERGFFCFDYFKNDPMLASLRSEHAFDELIEIARNRHERFKRTFL